MAWNILNWLTADRDVFRAITAENMLVDHHPDLERHPNKTAFVIVIHF